MKKTSFRKRLYCSVVAIVALFAVSGSNLHAAEITYHWGQIGGTQVPQTVTDGSTITLTNQGFSTSGFVLIGWHTMTGLSPMIPPLVFNLTLESVITKTMPTFYAVGDLLTVTEDLTLYAVWALDANGNGIPDYGQAVYKPTSGGVNTRRAVAAQTDDDVSLRSTPAWNYNFDRQAELDTIYFVGCDYNVLTGTSLDELLSEARITLKGPHAFDTSLFVRPNKPLNLVFEYGGVLEGMIGGSEQKQLDIFKITADMLPISLDSIFNNYSFRFTSIKEDGDATLKMYFIDPATDTFAIMTDFTLSKPTPWAKPFNGGLDDVYTVKFKLYNKPVFASEVFSPRLDFDDRLDLKHVSGTPLQYIMRSIGGRPWVTADSPLSNAEKGEMGDGGATICLRELDPGIGRRAFLADYYQTNAFDPSGSHWRELQYYSQEIRYLYNKTFVETILPTLALNPVQQMMLDMMYAVFVPGDPFPSSVPPVVQSVPAHPYDGNHPYDPIHAGIESGLSTLIPLYNPVAVINMADSTALADWGVLQKRYVDAIVGSSTPCRGMNCYAFETRGYPTITREVFIPQTSGVTFNVGHGAHFIQSQSDFTFTARYADRPLKITTNRIVANGEVEELTGTLIAGGEYEYVIRQVGQNIVLTIGPDFATSNSVVDGTSIWSHSNTIYIHVEKENVASIYSIAGQLVKQVKLSEGNTPIPMERGAYVVTLKDGSIHKVIVK